MNRYQQNQPEQQHHRRQHPCEKLSLAVVRCHKKYGKQGEECVREELSEKKCFAELLCRREAHRFYHQPTVNTGISCSTAVEAFAKPENEFLIPDNFRKEDRVECRKITHELAQCLAKKRGLIER